MNAAFIVWAALALAGITILVIAGPGTIRDHQRDLRRRRLARLTVSIVANLTSFARGMAAAGVSIDKLHTPSPHPRSSASARATHPHTRKDQPMSWHEEYQKGLADTAAAIDRLAEQQRAANLLAIASFKAKSLEGAEFGMRPEAIAHAINEATRLSGMPIVGLQELQ